jgi:hypothetical protein
MTALSTSGWLLLRDGTTASTRFAELRLGRLFVGNQSPALARNAVGCGWQHISRWTIVHTIYKPMAAVAATP